MKKTFEWMLRELEGQKSILRIIIWWELRRIPYNVIVGIFGLLSLTILFAFVELSDRLQPHEDVVEPMLLFMAPILINIGYTAGWVSEIVLLRIWGERANYVSPMLLKLGLTFSLFVIVLPTVIWCVILVLYITGVL